MSVIAVTRHPGAKAWLEAQAIAVDEYTDHFEAERISPGDMIIGTLPVHLAAEVCRRGATYYHLRLELPAHLRGRELSKEDMERLSARLEPYLVAPLAVASLPKRTKATP